MKTIILCGLALAAWSASAASVQLVSQIYATHAPSATAGGDSDLPITSPDGRFVLFASTANNLALASNNLPYQCPPALCYNVFLRDRASNTTVLVSVSADGTTGADQDAFPSAISTNGQFALFDSTADNLSPAAANSVNTIFRRDVLHGITLLVSANTNGVSGDDDSDDEVMTPDGRYVAFTSAADDLSADDTNGIPNVFVRDVQNGTTRLVSVGAMPSFLTGDDLSDAPVITPDGRYVAFYSSATNLVPGQTHTGDIFLRDLAAGTTSWISAQAGALYQAVTGSANAVACDPSLSADGEYLAFLVCTNSIYSYLAGGVVLRYNRTNGQTDLVATNGYVPEGSFESIQELDLTPDGRYLGYIGDVGDTSGANTAIYLWDGQSGTGTLVSADTTDALPAAAFCDSPCVSTNGQYVAFRSTGNLTANASGTDWHVYLRNVTHGTTALVDADTNGLGIADASILDVCLSADGSLVAFDSTRPTLTGNDRNQDYDVFLRNVAAGTTELVSARQPELPSYAGDAFSAMYAQPLSQDGRYLAFASYADDLVANDTNQASDIFVRDLYAATTVLASVGLGGAGASGGSYEAAISGNGRYVAFSSVATNLVAGYTSGAGDIFVRDLQAGTNCLVSVNAAGTGGGNNNSDVPVISNDGRFVLFTSLANNLAPGSYGQDTENLFLRDLQGGLTYALTTTGEGYASMTPDGHYIAFSGGGSAIFYIWDSLQARPVATNNATSTVRYLSISPDGNRVAYFVGFGVAPLYLLDRAAHTNWEVAAGVATTRAGLTFSADGNWLAYSVAPQSPGTNQVYLYNLPARTNILVSRQAGSLAPGDGSSDSPHVSPDGRFVVYRSAADNLATDDTNGQPEVLLFDTTTGSNLLVSASVYGEGAANGFSDTPVFSGDGRTLAFMSVASDLVAGDFNQVEDVFAYALLYANVSSDGSGNVMIDWPAAPGQTFAVQYKETLTDPTWHTFTGAITTNGNRASITDSSSGSASRFYRVVSNH